MIAASRYLNRSSNALRAVFVLAPPVELVGVLV
jgi:hypothetical protein